MGNILVFERTHVIVVQKAELGSSGARSENAFDGLSQCNHVSARIHNGKMRRLTVCSNTASDSSCYTRRILGADHLLIIDMLQMQVRFHRLVFPIFICFANERCQ